MRHLQSSLLFAIVSILICTSYFISLSSSSSFSSSSSSSYVLAAATADESSPEFKELLKQGDKLVVKGRNSYPEAIAKFSKALELIPGSPKALFRRAELMYLTMKQEEALKDLDEVIAQDGSHRRALEYRVKVLESLGRPEEAVRDYERLATVYAMEGKSAKSEEAHQKASQRKRVLQDWSRIKDHIDHLKDMEPAERGGICRECVRVIKELISVSGGGIKVDLRMKSAQCAVLGRLHSEATDELNKILKYQPNNLEAAALYAQELRSLGSMDRARGEIRRCLRLDPEYKPCMQLHKKMKKYTKVADVVEKKIAEKEWSSAMDDIDKLIAMGSDDAPNVEQLWRWKCEGYTHVRDVQKGFDACAHAIKLESGGGTAEDQKNPQLVDLYLWRADLYLMNDEIEEAERDHQRASNVNPDNQKVREFHQRLEKIKRQGERKDYYKILGVSKSATNAQIRKAYRKISKEYHPDLLRSKDLSEKDRARYDKLYRDCNEAKEILLDEEKRRRYDSGEDPTKPPEQQQHHGFHHHGGGHPGGFHFGGDQGFQFNFGGGGGGGFPGGGGGMPGGFQFHFG